MIEDLVRDVATGFEGHFTRALFISGALALLVTAVVGIAWWRGRRWMANRPTGRLGAGSHGPQVAMFSEDRSAPEGSAGGSQPGRHADRRPEEQPGARLIREAAARAAGLRDAWDRSYREARSGDAPAASTAAPTLDVLIEQLLREQRETNALLRQIAGQLEKSR